MAEANEPGVAWLYFSHQACNKTFDSVSAAITHAAGIPSVEFGVILSASAAANTDDVARMRDAGFLPTRVSLSPPHETSVLFTRRECRRLVQVAAEQAADVQRSAAAPDIEEPPRAAPADTGIGDKTQELVVQAVNGRTILVGPQGGATTKRIAVPLALAPECVPKVGDPHDSEMGKEVLEVVFHVGAKNDYKYIAFDARVTKKTRRMLHHAIEWIEDMGFVVEDTRPWVFMCNDVDVAAPDMAGTRLSELPTLCNEPGTPLNIYAKQKSLHGAADGKCWHNVDAGKGRCTAKAVKFWCKTHGKAVRKFGVQPAKALVQTEFVAKFKPRVAVSIHDKKLVKTIYTAKAEDGTGRRVQYLVSWSSGEDKTWVMANRVDANIIDSYERTLQDADERAETGDCAAAATTPCERPTIKNKQATHDDKPAKKRCVRFDI